MKKLFAFILSLSLIFTLSACGDKKANAQIDDGDDTAYTVQEGNENVTSNAVVSKNETTQSSSSPNTQNSNSETSKVTEPVANEERPETVTKIYDYEEWGAAPTPDKKDFHDSQNGNTLPYALYIPEGYKGDKAYPVILYLHGAGALGNDNTRQLESLITIFNYNGDLASQFIIICPQTDVWWSLDRDYDGDKKGTLSSAMNLLKEILATYTCDSNRLFVTGVSMGGYATWDVLERYGSTFAAGVPICGAGDESMAYFLKDVPIRIYHGTADPTVSFDASQRMYNAIKGAGGTMVELFALEGVKHNADDYAYSDRDFFCWLLAQTSAKKGAEKYEVSDRFKIVDASGNTVINEDDIVGIGSVESSGSVDVEITLSNEGREKLEKAYTKSGGKEFTVYCLTQKVYSFTAVKAPIDNIFSVSGVFKDTNYMGFYKVIQRLCLNMT